MDNLLLVGINYKVAEVSLRERLAFNQESILQALHSLRDQRLEEQCEIALLSTCNRTEIITHSSNPCRTEEVLRQFLSETGGIPGATLDKVLYVYHQADAARHLLQVAAGLDSLVVGENEIQGQVRSAHDLAQAAGTSGPILNMLFRCAIQCGKRVRAETEIGQTRLSVASVVVELAEQRLGALQHHTALLIGAGKISTLAARELVNAGLRCVLVANRTFERAQKLVENLGTDHASAVHFDQLIEKLGTADIVICSTGAPHIVLHAEDVAPVMKLRPQRPLLVVDLALPRDADPALDAIPQVDLYAIDDLSELVQERHPLTAQAWTQAEAIVEARLRAFDDWCEARQAAPLIRSLRAKAELIVQEEIERTLSRLGTVSPEQQAAIEYMGQAIVNKILHEPITCLKSQSAVSGVDNSRELVEALFGLEQNMHES
jgi:glutamyl-tRNA reductase